MSDIEVDQISIIVKNNEDEIESEYNTDLDSNIYIIDKDDIEQNINQQNSNQQNINQQNRYYIMIINPFRFCVLYYIFVALLVVIYYCFYT